MNFKKLQEMQRALDDAILKEKPEMTSEERFEKTCVALSVEIAELANTAERFKFWKDNKGKIDNERFIISGVLVNKENTLLDKADGQIITRKQAHKLTLVEEASDCLHFILSLANQSDVVVETDKVVFNDFNQYVNNNVTYMELNGLVYDSFSEMRFNSCLVELFIIYLESLGITQDELEQAYYDKNEINYQRLEQGY